MNRPPQRPWADRRLAGNVLSLALLLVSLLTGASGLRHELRAASTTVARVQAAPRDHGQLVPGRAWAGRRMGFAAFARRLIPPGEPVRIVQPVLGRPRQARVCRNGVSYVDHFWLAYQLAPRPETCEPLARWSIYLGIAPGPLPPGARAHVYAPDLVVVERSGRP